MQQPAGKADMFLQNIFLFFLIKNTIFVMQRCSLNFVQMALHLVNNPKKIIYYYIFAVVNHLFGHGFIQV